MNNINLPTLAQVDAEVLDKPLTVGMKEGKSD